MKNMDDYQATIDYAVKKAEAIGVTKTAKSMLAYGLDPVAVARITKLPKKQIMAMR
jgi:hypothetical protein